MCAQEISLAPSSPAVLPLDTSSLPQDFETALAELESLVSAMEDGSMPLEQALASYQRGVELTRICQERLAKAKQHIKVLEGELLRPLDANALEDE